MSLTVVTKYKKEGKLFTQLSVRNYDGKDLPKVLEMISSKYPDNKSFEITNEGSVTNFNIEFQIDDSLESNSFINAIYSIIDSKK